MPLQGRLHDDSRSELGALACPCNDIQSAEPVPSARGTDPSANARRQSGSNWPEKALGSVEDHGAMLRRDPQQTLVWTGKGVVPDFGFPGLYGNRRKSRLEPSAARGKREDAGTSA